jgi:hypothetical protein
MTEEKLLKLSEMISLNEGLLELDLSLCELTNNSLKYFKKSFEIDTTLLDHYKFTDIDFIKIDVDSHEGFLLEGAVNFFKNNNPVIMIESKDKDQKKYQNPSMLHPITFLEKIGYTVQEIAGNADYILTKGTI